MLHCSIWIFSMKNKNRWDAFNRGNITTAINEQESPFYFTMPIFILIRMAEKLFLSTIK